MAISKARTLTVGTKRYQWKVLPTKDRYTLGWTPGNITVIIRSEGVDARMLCRSKHWTDQHEEMFYGGATHWSPPAHKVPFGPRQVRQLIDEGLKGSDLIDWTVTVLGSQ